jgi:hypothetical protein
MTTAGVVVAGMETVVVACEEDAAGVGAAPGDDGDVPPPVK